MAVTSQQREDYGTTFDIIDSDGSDYLEIKELIQLFDKFGADVSSEQVQNRVTVFSNNIQLELNNVNGTLSSYR